MRIATWNVNSLRTRIDRVEAFLDRHDVDVLAVQETKAREEQLPLMGLQSRGYDVAAVGYNQWNGVALISRVGLEDVTVGFPDMPGFGDPVAAEARALGATCGGVRIWSPPAALVGDWNICPTDDDVFDVKQFRTSTHVTPPERAAFQGFLDDGWAEVTREHAPGYTYWDYYRQRFERDRGLKIDFVVSSPALAARVTGAFIDREERKGKGASDHAPVVVDLA